MARQIIRKCKNCGSKLPEGAVFCDMCGEPVARRKEAVVESRTESKDVGSGKQTKKKWRNVNEERSRKRIGLAVGVIVAAVVVIGAVIGIAAIYDSRNIADEHTDAPKNIKENLPAMDSRVTVEQYEALKFGMTYDEVVELLGEEGGRPEYSYGNDCTWPGEYYDEGCFYEDDRPRINLQFSEDWRLIGMEEINVIDGRTIRDNLTERTTARVEVNEKTIDSIKKGTAYTEVTGILGAEGILTNSESDNSGHDTRTYTWEYLGKDYYGKDEYKELKIIFNNGKAAEIDYDGGEF